MSIFGTIMRDFDHDPFFSNQLETMRRMENMMDNMMAPFGMMGMGFPRITGGDNRRQDQMNPFSNSLMPFGFGRSLFPNIGNMFTNMPMVPTPNLHSYSSSSVMTYTTDENGVPQVYQATSSTRTAPGGVGSIVKETRNSVQDSRSGLQKLAIGHHLGERAHIIEKEQNRFTGEQNENQEFINLEEEEAEAFNHEWQEKAQPIINRRNRQNGNQLESRLRVEELPSLPAIMDAHSSAEADDNTPEPIITEPDCEPVISPPRSRLSSNASSSSRKRDSPDVTILSNSHHKPNREIKHKRRHHAYQSGVASKTGHRSDKKSLKSRHETTM